MDPLDEALLDAWNKLSPKLRTDRAQALSRAARAEKPTYCRPVRPWCLCLRASDTRIADLALLDDERKPDDLEPHSLFLTAPALRNLCAPVYIDWPGIHWTHAAARLGRHPSSLQSWIKRGIFQVEYKPRVQRNYTPFLWTRSPLDPGAEMGRPPDHHWGTLWQHLHKQITQQTALLVQRVPSFRPDPRPSKRDDGTRARGWRFTCPGLRPAGRADRPRPPRQSEPFDPPATTCGRRVARLFLPRPVPSIFDSLVPGFARSTRTLFHDCWACDHCHKVLNASLIQKDGWNFFISHLTRGLLFGREVAKPPDLVIQRRRAYSPRKRAAPRRDRVLKVIAAGLTNRQAAAKLGVAPRTIKGHLDKLFQQHDAHSRAQLLAKLGLPPIKKPPTAAQEAARTADVVIDMLRRRLSHKQMAERLHIPLWALSRRLSHLCKARGVRSVAELRTQIESVDARGAAKSEPPQNRPTPERRGRH